jgi:glyceraldehyde 3-phosphate dehydrogenase
MPGTDPIRVAVNGMGRMGRLWLRDAWGFDPAAPHTLSAPDGAWGAGAIEVVHVNEPNGDAATVAHLTAFDSVYGRWPVPVAADGEHAIAIGDRRVGFSRAASPDALDWGALGLDVVVECSGRFRTRETLAPYFRQGVRKVVVSAPVKGAALNIVMGVNHEHYDPAAHDVVTAASCTTNCLAPVVKVVHEGIGIRHGTITTIHDVTNTQTVHDRPMSDLRRARSALLNLVPTTTGSATAITYIFPELSGKLDGVAVRVPLLNASLTDCVFEVARETTVDEVNALLEAAAEGPLAGILGVERRALVSTDFRGDRRSSIVDAPSTRVTDGTQVKILAWYDNEMGYACRLRELTEIVAGSLVA